MQIRRAAKGIISTNKGEIIIVTGLSGRLNLPGGGIDKLESPRQAFLREIDEEIDGLSQYIDDLNQQPETISGPVSSKEGEQFTAEWTLFAARLLIPASELKVASTHEIQAISAMTPEECMSNNQMSELAKTAINTTLIFNGSSLS